MAVIPDLKEIRVKRKKAGLSQAELATMVGISQSHLAKIEQRKVDPGYRLVTRLFDALDKMKRDECWQYMSAEIMFARAEANVEEQVARMKEKGFSQLPVMAEGRVIGLLTERRILALTKPYHTLLVKDAMEEPVLVPKETSYEAVLRLLDQYQAVLVQERGEIVGIITMTDLLGHKPRRSHVA